MTSRAPEEDMWDDYMKTPPPSSPTLPPDASSSTAYGSTAPPATAQGSIGAGANDEADASLDIVFKTPPPSSPIPTPLGYTLVNDHPSLEVNASTPSSETRPHNHLPSNHQDIPSATSSFPEPVQRHELKWSGVLAAYHINRLRQDFGETVICPGYVAQFGGKADRWGRVYMPGATSSYSAAKKVWQKWKKANEDQRFAWWPAEMERRNIEPICCRDVLDGLSLARWQAYRKHYLRASGTRNSKARRERARRDARAQALEDEEDVDAAGPRHHLQASPERGRGA